MDTCTSPQIICPECGEKKDIENVLTALSNQNVIYDCPVCGYQMKNIVTKKG
ncbi:MAG: CPXCG motif-containing cysteine-rich protein [Bacillota bacterium]